MFQIQNLQTQKYIYQTQFLKICFKKQGLVNVLIKHRPWEISQCHAPRLSGTRHPSAPREMKEWNGMLVLKQILKLLSIPFSKQPIIINHYLLLILMGFFYNSEWLSLDLNGYSLFLVVINNG